VVGVVCAFVGFTLKPGPLAAFPAIENPFGLDGFPGELVGELGYIALVILLIAAVASFRVRWRRGSPLERFVPGSDCRWPVSGWPASNGRRTSPGRRFRPA